MEYENFIYRMRNVLILAAILFGSSLTATEVRFNTRNKVNHRSNWYSSSAGPVGSVRIVIDKSDYELNVYDEKGWYATYPVVFGNNTLSDKKMEGDKNTPEGTFKINSKRVHEKWCRFMGIDYPTPESREKFNQRKQRGEIPQTARIGGSIGIHGTWPREDFVIDRYKNWTLGCISMKNDDVKELYAYTKSGSDVLIRK